MDMPLDLPSFLRNQPVRTGSGSDFPTFVASTIKHIAHSLNAPWPGILVVDRTRSSLDGRLDPNAVRESVRRDFTARVDEDGVLRLRPKS